MQLTLPSPKRIGVAMVWAIICSVIYGALRWNLPEGAAILSFPFLFYLLVACFLGGLIDYGLARTETG